MIFVIAGELEQWIEDKMQILKAGESVYINAGVAHAPFASGDQPVKYLSIHSPCLEGVGFEIVDIAGEEPWKTMRKSDKS